MGKGGGGSLERFGREIDFFFIEMAHMEAILRHKCISHIKVQ